MSATAIAPITTISNAANERARHALNLALGELFRLDGRATVVRVEIESERPVLVIDQPVPIPGAHYITRNIDGRRLSLWVAQEGGCQIECEAPQPLPAAVRR